MTGKDVLDKLQAEIREVCLEPSCVGPHTEPGGTLYHYTDGQGLIGIIESGTVWATSLHCLNDPRETEYGLDMCRSHLQTLQKKPKKLQRLVTSAVDSTVRGTSILAPYTIQVAACFSQEGDLLSQWRAYADNGRGLALGFDSHALVDILCRQCEDANSGTTPNYIPRVSIYSLARQRKLLNAVTKLVFQYREILNALGAEPMEDVDDTLGVYLAWGLASASMAFKAPGFAEEKEVRLTIANIMEIATAKTPLDVKARTRNGRLLTYREINLRDERGLLPLRRIVLGPAVDYGRAELSLRQYLQTHGYENAVAGMPEIAKSYTSLRA